MAETEQEDVSEGGNGGSPVSLPSYALQRMGANQRMGAKKYQLISPNGNIEEEDLEKFFDIFLQDSLPEYRLFLGIAEIYKVNGAFIINIYEGDSYSCNSFSDCIGIYFRIIQNNYEEDYEFILDLKVVEEKISTEKNNSRSDHPRY